MRKPWLILLLILALCHLTGVRAVEAVTELSTAAPTGPARVSPASANADRKPLPNESALSNQLRTMPGQPRSSSFTSAAEQTSVAKYVIVFSALAVIGCIVIVRLLGGRLYNRVPVAATTKDVQPNILAENKSFTEFARSFREGGAVVEAKTSMEVTAKNSVFNPTTVEIVAATSGNLQLAPGLKSEVGPEPKPQAVATAPEPKIIAEKKEQPVLISGNPELARKHLALARDILSRITLERGDGARHNQLLELSKAIGLFKANTSPHLLEAWQIASALEGLLKQLADQAQELTLSSLRTAGNALELLDKVCVPGLKINQIMDPPVRVLVVDDDAISRQAIGGALKKVFGNPDLAPGGDAALALAKERTYDVIFLDVEMSGIDGFEVCTRLQETETNRNTPVVFVTRHTNFESRAKSTISGGQDLIAKPFLTFELALKALTLVVNNRLSSAGVLGINKCVKSDAALHPASISDFGTTHAAEKTVSEATAAGLENRSDRGCAPEVKPSANRPAANQASQGQPAYQEIAETLFERVPADLQSLSRQAETLAASNDSAERLAGLGALYVGVHTLTQNAAGAKLDSTYQLSWALESMLKKLLEQPKQITSSALNIAKAALELLAEMTANRHEPKLGTVKILVVDDDIISRRAVASSLQIIFGRPESADSGEAAIALATEKQFDLIFMDVRMPGMDGFLACSKIHETGPNTQTPVVFVTGHSDAAAQVTLCGGDGFITKPILASEIRLTALTFALRGSLRKIRNLEPAACLA